MKNTNRAVLEFAFDEVEVLPEVIKDMMDGIKTTQVFSEGTLLELMEKLFELEEDSLWEKWDFGGDYRDIHSAELGTFVIKADAYAHATGILDLNIRRFINGYSTFMTEGAQEEYEAFKEEIMIEYIVNSALDLGLTVREVQ